jgi:hypothetical protein
MRFLGNVGVMGSCFVSPRKMIPKKLSLVFAISIAIVVYGPEARSGQWKPESVLSLRCRRRWRDQRYFMLNFWKRRKRGEITYLGSFYVARRWRKSGEGPPERSS